MELVRATEISDGVVLAISVNTLGGPTGPLAGRHQAMSTNVITRPVDGDRALAHRLEPPHLGDGLMSPATIHALGERGRSSGCWVVRLSRLSRLYGAAVRRADCGS